jgi:signal peptidase I
MKQKYLGRVSTVVWVVSLIIVGVIMVQVSVLKGQLITTAPSDYLLLLLMTAIVGMLAFSVSTQIRFGKQIVFRSFTYLLIVSSIVTLSTLLSAVSGFIAEPVSITGTGSMYPTFPKGEGKDEEALSKQIVASQGMIRYPNGITFFGKHLFGHTLTRGDIVVFDNTTVQIVTKEQFGEASSMVKRIIALPGDTLEIRGGIVYLNNTPQKEPYTASARSTFGGTFLGECTVLRIPEGKVFVMGDNRKGSGDSRHEVGLISMRDINHVFPWTKQRGILDRNWRETRNDFSDSAKIRLDKDRFVALLNHKREEAGKKPLVLEPKLSESAALRGRNILLYNDFSFEASRSGYTMEKAMRDANYRNIVWGEVFDQGYYDASELLENQFATSDSTKFLLDGEYEEIGIAEVEGSINGCPTQVIVQHFAGYVPPNYPQEDIDSWKRTLEELQDIQPGWLELKEDTEVYDEHKEKVDRLHTVIAERITIAETIISRMTANQWLTDAEEEMSEHDDVLYEEQAGLAAFFNSL